MSLILTSKTIERYFKFLTKLDNSSKKKLIIKLTESIENNGKREFDMQKLYGAWEDDKDSDEIIKEIRESRINKHNISDF